MGGSSSKVKFSLKSTLEDYVVITLGVFFYTFAWADMLIPNGIDGYFLEHIKNNLLMIS